MNAFSPTRRARGFTLIELLVVISIIAILAGLLIPTISMVKKLVNQTADGHDMHQVVMSMLAYQVDHDGSWPAVYATADGTTTDRAGADPLATAIASLELLVFETGRELPNQVFASRGLPSVRPSDLAGDIRTSGSSAWAVAAAADDNQTPAWAYDWSVPANAGSMRVVLAHRGHGFYDGTVVAAYSDGHTQKWNALRDTPSSGGSYQLADLRDPATKAWVARNPMGDDDAVPDNIYDDEGDDGSHDAIGRGSARRAAVK